MADDDKIELVGVRINTDGTKDYGRALRVVDTNTAPVPEISGSREVIRRASEVGVSEHDLVNYQNRLSGHSGVRLERKIDTNQFAKEHSIPPEAALGLVRDYAKEKVKETENGILFHYHQMPMDKVEGVIADGALLSSETQKALGRKTGGSARPDVVQMTRDEYDKAGKMKKAGLGGAYLMGPDMVTWVFKPSIMGIPGYDCTGQYPDLPSIPIKNDYVEALLVLKPDDIEPKKTALERAGIKAPVMTRDEWRAKTYK